MWSLVLALLTGSASAATLAEALAAAEANSLDLQLLRENTRAAESMPAQAWSLLQPKLVASGNYNWNEREVALDFSSMIPPEFADLFPASDPIVVQPKRYGTAAFTVQQSLFSGSAVPALLGAYKYAEATRQDEARARGQLRLGVVQVYYGLLTARDAEVLTADAVGTAKDALSLAERSLAAESTTRRTVLQAELALSQALRDQERAREARVAAEELFVQLTGLPRDTPLSVPPPPEIPASLAVAKAAATESRPDLLAAEARISAAHRQQQANWAGWAPEVTGRFTWAYTENTAFSTDKTPWMAVVEGQWVLWDGGYRLAKAREYGAQAHMASLARDRLVITADSEVTNAWEKHRRATAAVEATEREVALAEASLDLAKRAFEAEQIAWIEVEQAELYAQKARLDRLSERMNRDVAAYELLLAAGAW